MVRAGELRHRITIQQLTQVSDGMGGYTESWTDYATVWAAVEPLKGREYFEAKKIETAVDIRVRIRYLSGVTPDMRVIHNGRTLQIHSIINVEERNKELHLMCSEVV